jgi:hypothetical protein
MRIGIDFGGVLSVHDKSGEVGEVKEHKNTSINMPGALDALEKLSGENTLHLVSFCGKRRAIESHRSLKDSGCDRFFTTQTYVKNIKYKKDICKHYNLHVMIDDRENVLDSVVAFNSSIVTILFGDTPPVSGRHLHSKNWEEVLDKISQLYRFDEEDEEVYEPNMNKISYILE